MGMEDWCMSVKKNRYLIVKLGILNRKLECPDKRYTLYWQLEMLCFKICDIEWYLHFVLTHDCMAYSKIFLV